MLENLRQAVCEANLQLVRAGLVIQTFGNASGIDRASGHVVIKPSGVDYDKLQPQDMVVLSLATGQVVEGNLRPSSDTPTHLVLYRAFPNIGGIVHTHSLYATAWAQACREIPPLGTTHADFFNGPVPCTRRLTAQEINTDYETNTGHVIVERLKGGRGTKAAPTLPIGILVAQHGPFAWGATVAEAVEHAVALEYCARLASETLRLQPRTKPISAALLAKHYQRKHGAKAYYGQK